MELPHGELMILLVCDDITEARHVREELRESEARYRLLVDMIPQHVWITDPDGQHTYFSRRWYDYTGAAPEATHGEGWLELLHPDDRPAVVQKWQHSLRTGESYEVQYRFRSATGDFHWFLGQALPQRDPEGAIVRWIGTLTDIEEQKRVSTERERLLEREREAREQISTILSSISDAFVAVDAQWRLTYMNPVGQRLLQEASGKSGGDLLGHTLPESLPEVWNSEFGQIHRRAMAERTTVHFESYLPAWKRWFSVNDYPSGDGLAIYFQDITERKNAEQQRERLLADAQRRREELERITESRERLMRGFSHDLKNPLGAADGHAQLLEDGILGEVTPKQMDSIRRIRRSITASIQLITDLLELARAETGQLELNCERADVASVARDAVADFRGQAEAEGLTVRCEIPHSCETVTDADRVRQILSNLLSNALKYTAEGEVSVEVEESTRREGTDDRPWIAVRISDTGPGIPPDKHEQIFEEFTRLDPGAPHGAGVGLAISRRIARLLDGDITVESEVGRGACFTLWLPRA